MDKACKSSDHGRPQGGHESGKRVRNTWGTCPTAWDNTSKGVLIPDRLMGSHGPIRKGGEAVRLLLRMEGPVLYQLVGRVMAYQGDDG